MATYKEIQEWVKTNYGFSVKSCWIAHMKEINGLNPLKSWNRIDPDSRSNPCPENLKEPITKAMIHFCMI